MQDGGRRRNRLSSRAWVFVTFVCAALSAPARAECEYRCNPNSGPCADDVPARVEVCSDAHAARLVQAKARCSILVIGEMIAAGHSVDVIAASIDIIPRCDQRRLTRAGGASADWGGVFQLAPRVGDVDVTEQREKYTDGPPFYDMYHVYEDFQKRWASMAARGKDVRSEVIGKTVQGRDLQMLRIGRTSESNPRRVFINGLQHAREWAAAMTVTYIADQLTDSLTGRPGVGGKYTSDMAAVRDILQTVEVLVVPISNPDGYVYTRQSRFHRKNMRVNAGSSCVGVDLNRNWGKGYGAPASTSTKACDDVYIGAGAFSEPETAALRDALTSNAGVRAQVDYHSYGGMILGPWSYTGEELPPNADAWREFGDSIDGGMQSVRGTKYRMGLGTDKVLSYFAAGVMSDWTYAQGLMSATIEVHPVLGKDVTLGLSGFVLDAAGMRQSCEDNFGGFVGLLRYINATATDGQAPSGSSPSSGPGGDKEVSAGVEADPPGTVSAKASGLSNKVYIGIGVGVSVALLVILLILFLLCRQRSNDAEKKKLGI
jgi:hypothetical protein